MGDKENGINKSINLYVTVICYYVIATYRHLLFSIILASTITTTKVEAYLVKTKYSQCYNETNGALTAYLRPVGRLYSSFTTYWKAVQFIYGPLEGRMVYLRPIRRPYGSFTGRKQDLQPAQSTILREDFLRISFMFYSFIFTYFFYILQFYFYIFYILQFY